MHKDFSCSKYSVSSFGVVFNNCLMILMFSTGRISEILLVLSEIVFKSGLSGISDTDARLESEGGDLLLNILSINCFVCSIGENFLVLDGAWALFGILGDLQRCGSTGDAILAFSCERNCFHEENLLLLPREKNYIRITSSTCCFNRCLIIFIYQTIAFLFKYLFLCKDYIYIRV